MSSEDLSDPAARPPLQGQAAGAAARPTAGGAAPVAGGHAAATTPALAGVPAVAAAGRRPRWSSRTLLAGSREVEIEHESVVYRLQLTSLGKLILTK